MSFLFDWSDCINSVRRELIFADRNKLYGAYDIRKNYRNGLIRAFAFTITAVVIFSSIYLIFNFRKSSDGKNSKITNAIILEEPPPIDEYAPPPPPVVLPTPVIRTLLFTPPKVVEDIKIEDLPPTQEETKNIQVGTVTQEGVDMIQLPPDPVLNTEDDNKVFTVVEEMPYFPGGERKLNELLSHINYPRTARENNISGAVYITFIVEKDGKINDAKVVKGIGGGCDEEALRVLKSLPDWIPGKQNGRPVFARSTVRVSFTLQ